MYRLLDIFFTVFHGNLVVFEVSGWAWKRTRRIHLITTGLTILSWFGLGLFYGWGYCPCTDWHWRVKGALGQTNLPDSYIKYYADRLTGVAWGPLLVDAIVLLSGLMAFALSLWLNMRDCRSCRHGR